MFTFRGPLSILVILIIGVSTLVPPPENVTVSCNNFKTIVYWNYSEPSRQPSFDLKVTSDFSENIITSIRHNYDLTQYIWSSDELDRYFVNITANDGTETSGSQESLSFTFNKYKTATIQCKLDFPDVNLSMEDEMVKVRFKNPYHLYPELRLARMRGDDRVFHYTVFYDNNTGQGFECKDKVICDKNIIVQEKRQQYCFSLDGSAMEHKLEFKRKENICISHENKADLLIVYLPIILTSIILVAIGTIITWQKKIHNLPKTLANLPKALLLPNTHPKDDLLHMPKNSVVDICSIEPAVTQSLLEMPEEELQDPPYPDGYGLPDDVSSPVSGYDRRHVEMSPDDVAECYTIDIS
ncbi:hypothetical protein DPEC_G00175410 [Dallia pectoralis]|uniref:Uncharacterized protein n=1 Tax=Dallia pectoralis TaxID=75939 RepID=A0ACC2GER4_DALPE|nr:hypothetical protein DPEC_G00175410 [Dallia pectoralis]